MCQPVVGDVSAKRKISCCRMFRVAPTHAFGWHEVARRGPATTRMILQSHRESQYSLREPPHTTTLRGFPGGGCLVPRLDPTKTAPAIEIPCGTSDSQGRVSPVNSPAPQIERHCLRPGLISIDFDCFVLVYTIVFRISSPGGHVFRVRYEKPAQSVQFHIISLPAFPITR